MSNVSISLRTLRSLTCASLATMMMAACGGGGGGSTPGTDTAAAGSGTSSSGAKTGSAAAAGQSTPKDGPFGQDAGNYTLTFSEEFNSFNPDLWNDKMWYESSNPTKNYTVEDGKLKIWPQRDASGKFFNRTIDSDGKYTQKYGYFEVEAKLPKGKGTWPAFWLFNHIGERRPEMDVMEAYAGGEGWGHNDANGVARPTVYAATVWEGASDSNNRQLGFKMYDAKTDLSEGFHKYAVKWEPNKQTYYFDGKEILVLNISMNDPMYLMLDLWQGSAAGMMDDSTPQGKSNSYEVNYVRAWQFK
ncbi:glycoside hydrolase family 16 protein [Oxalobacteraceae bacterium R-40]|uniref:Glycoside hydrolase family 16 protein n=1 Tax=Keguizhuia sedimenti TaxID=3064264 RepID=A0ABU1BPB2_9BURK|nr:glycoside hydrolase family 16 protein [Oxalobacteraceae bacterium R-40]